MVMVRLVAIKSDLGIGLLKVI